MFGEGWVSDPGTKQQSSVDELTALKPRVQTEMLLIFTTFTVLWTVGLSPRVRLFI